METIHEMDMYYSTTYIYIYIYLCSSGPIRRSLRMTTGNIWACVHNGCKNLECGRTTIKTLYTHSFRYYFLVLLCWCLENCSSFIFLFAACFFWNKLQKQHWFEVFSGFWSSFTSWLAVFFPGALVCARIFKVIGRFAFRTNPANFPAFKAQKGTLRMQPVRRIFLCAGCFFFSV